MFIFLKVKQMSIFKRKTYQTMKGNEQMAMKISPTRREDLVNGASGTTNKKLVVGREKVVTALYFVSFPLEYIRAILCVKRSQESRI